ERARLREAVGLLVSGGYGRLVEVSPHPVLRPALEEALEESGKGGAVVGTLRRGEGGMERMLQSLLEHHVGGGEVEWGRAQRGRRVSLPGYAFQRRRHWLDPLPTPAPDVAPAGLRPAAHPLLAASVELADGGRVLTGRLTASSPGWLSGHRVR